MLSLYQTQHLPWLPGSPRHRRRPHAHEDGPYSRRNMSMAVNAVRSGTSELQP